MSSSSRNNQEFTFEDLKKIRRKTLGNQVPLELFRAVRLIGMYQGLPMNGKGTTGVVGRKIGESIPAKTIEEFFEVYRELKIGLPSLVHKDENSMYIAVNDCFCEGLPQFEGKFVCDLEGSIMEGAFSKILGKSVTAKEVKCNVNGDERCEYEIKIR